MLYQQVDPVLETATQRNQALFQATSPHPCYPSHQRPRQCYIFHPLGLAVSGVDTSSRHIPESVFLAGLGKLVFSQDSFANTAKSMHGMTLTTILRMLGQFMVDERTQILLTSTKSSSVSPSSSYESNEGGSSCIVSSSTFIGGYFAYGAYPLASSSAVIPRLQISAL
mmetsp:Transcript_33769/g.51797  ORF Transcript_33769/g.51797 Transcript_33769/m.51797 type:complete len:168 (-) Transcript_33769:578-1081(-)